MGKMGLVEVEVLVVGLEHPEEEEEVVVAREDDTRDACVVWRAEAQ